MTPEERYEALAAADAVDVEQLADVILASGADIEVVAGPESVTAALRMPVPATRASSAVLGHVALTSCTVRLGGVRGDGMRPGRDLTGALSAAVCDAEAERGGPHAAAVEALCSTAIAGVAEAATARADLVAATRIGPSL